MKTINILLIIIFASINSLCAQGIFKGKVYDDMQKALPGSSIWIGDLKIGASTNLNGEFEIKNIPAGVWDVKISMIGYYTITERINIEDKKTQIISIKLIENKQMLNEIVISASRNPEKLSDIPASISIVNSKMLKVFAQSTSNINDILEFSVPGLAPSTGTSSNWGQTMRGRNLLVMLDGIPQTSTLRNGKVGMKSVSPMDIQRVEVIKGATAIYGNGSDGGFINYITKRNEAQKALEGETNIWGTSNLADTKDAQGFGIHQSFKGKKDNLAYYFSGSYEETGNKYDADGKAIMPTYGLDNMKIMSVMTKLSYDISTNQSIGITAMHYQSRQNSPFTPTNAELIVLNKEGDYTLTPGYGIISDSPNMNKASGPTNTNLMLNYNIKDIFNNSTNFNVDAYFQKSKNIFFYSDRFIGGGQSVINAKKYGLRPNFKTSLDLNNALKLDLTYGLDILQDNTNQGLLDGRLWVPNMKLRNYAPYMQANFKIDNSWTVKAGVRYDKMDLDIEDFSSLAYDAKGDGNFTDPVQVKGDILKFSNTAFNIGIRFIENEKFTPYVNYSQGFALPDLGRTLRGARATNVNDINLEAVVTNNYEFGFLSKFEHVRFEAVAYYSTSNLGTGLNFNDEINRFELSKSPQKIYGTEVSVDFKFMDDALLFGSSYSYVEGLKHPKNDANNLSYIGGDVISPSKLTAYISIQASKKLNTTIRMIRVGDRKRFSPVEDGKGGWKYNYREAPVNGYTLLNLSASYQVKENLSIALAVNNMLNKYYLPARAQWAAPLKGQSPVGEGANAKFSLNYKF